ncbi:GTP-binding protein [Amycolatopsis suaedae]|uniref:CobW/HypB/UreG nucleotide-binding domain-containing protein n=1 Tax=Amycolatopsis suaedae TaxID=2510978 RepID=A0A4Q7J1R2_9PSEU|nr:GTP-binding protein [Amycolatopsis suaedae]RZQ60522.1 hypothetical protein EWH70_27970 [Amycolatopsis suaedae]
MLFVPLGGFLGAGKTTTMLAAGRLLEAGGEKVSVITNDQGVDLVDTELAHAAGVATVDEVTGGCFCCRFDDLAEVIARLRTTVRPTVVLAEAVGSCADLQATVVRPLRRLLGDTLTVAPLTVLVDPARHAELGEQDTESDLAYLYRHQLDEADVIAVNKIDAYPAEVVARVRARLRHRFPHATVVPLSARTGDGLRRLAGQWNVTAAPARVPSEVDYDRYGAAEAELAWTNQRLRLDAVGTGFVPASWVDEFLLAFRRGAQLAGLAVGHVKLRLRTAGGSTKASLTSAGAPPSFDERQAGPAREGDLVLNARVRTSPDNLDALIDRCVAAADAAAATSSGERTGVVFRPGYPVPVHRMTAD